MRRIFLSLVLGLVVLVGTATAAYAQHHGGHGGGFGGHGGGFGGFGGHGGGFGGHGGGFGGHGGGFGGHMIHPGGGHMVHPNMHHAVRPQSIQANAARPSSRVPTHRINAARPSNRVPSHKINAARPSNRVPTHNINAARPSSRTPALASARPTTAKANSHRPGLTGGKGANHALGLANNKTNGRLSGNTRDLTSADNTTLNTLKPNLTSPQAIAGINAALAGKPMTKAEVNALQGLLAGNKLSGQQAGAVAAALQTDQQIKRQLALNNAISGLASGSSLSGLNGISGGSGGSGGLGGGCPSTGGGGDNCSPAISADPSPDAPSPAPLSDSGTEPAAEEEDQGGVLLQEVTEGAAADRAGLRVGDVILSFGGVRINSFEELRDAVQQSGGPVKVVFINGENGQIEYVTVEPEDGRIGVVCD